MLFGGVVSITIISREIIFEKFPNESTLRYSILYFHGVEVSIFPENAKEFFSHQLPEKILQLPSTSSVQVAPESEKTES